VFFFHFCDLSGVSIIRGKNISKPTYIIGGLLYFTSIWERSELSISVYVALLKHYLITLHLITNFSHADHSKLITFNSQQSVIARAQLLGGNDTSATLLWILKLWMVIRDLKIYNFCSSSQRLSYNVEHHHGSRAKIFCRFHLTARADKKLEFDT
jgi:hypothetical protein